MKPVIEIQDLGKKYQFGKTTPYIALRDVIAGSLKNLFDKRQTKKYFWALEHIDMQVEQGERVGIIGSNGAGKTTLLKIISRITSPTTGKAIIRGRVGSLLEVGTGFHPELTGRENIYLNGSILGLRKKEINRKLDEIISFSGVEDFINEPIKFYSSGMELRLAFSVAAHLEPEILLIDEVLAVGDLEFQKKCLTKMEEVSRSQGRTIIFVSHNMNYISSLCSKGILIDKGKIMKIGATSEVVSSYVTKVSKRSGNVEWNENEMPGDHVVRLRSVNVIDENGSRKESFKVNEKIGIEMRYSVLENGHVVWLGHNIFNQQGLNIFDTHSVNSPYYNQPHEKGEYVSVVWIPGNFLNTGTYLVGSAAFNHSKQTIHFHERDIILFSVHEIFEEETARGMSPGDFPGLVRPLLNWTIDKQ